MTKVGSNLYNDAAGIIPSGLGNPDLQWEEAAMTDIALEMEFFNSRLRSSIGYFQKKSDNLIYSQNMPLSSSFSSMTANMASTTTKGFEFSLDYDIVKNAKWQLTYNINGAFNNSYVDRFNNSTNTVTSSYTKIEIGQKVGQWYGYQSYKRLFGSAEEVTALRTRTETGGINSYWTSVESDGDVYLVDQNGDGKINTDIVKLYSRRCPKCGYPLKKEFNGRLGLPLWICSNEPELCDFMTNSEVMLKDIFKCQICDGYMIVKKTKDKEHYFYGCTNYDSGRGCMNVLNFDEVKE
jgi:ssDNA-binding Zn-finger/Zn-ribbon topoisomerase 1